MGSLFELILAPFVLVPAMGWLSRHSVDDADGQERRRKALHVLMGFVALGLPHLLTSTWMVLGAVILATLWMIAVRNIGSVWMRFGRVLDARRDDSRGELYFICAIGVLLLLPQTLSVQYIIPVLILTLADTAAALVGRRAPEQSPMPSGNHKSVRGCAAFFLTALLVTGFTLAVLTAWDSATIASASFCVAVVTCIAEALSLRGSDNLTVPVAAYLVLLPFVVYAGV